MFNNLTRLIIVICVLNVCMDANAVRGDSKGRSILKKGHVPVKRDLGMVHPPQRSVRFAERRALIAQGPEERRRNYQRILADIESAIKTDTNLESIKGNMRSLAILAETKELRCLNLVWFAHLVNGGCFRWPTLDDNREAQQCLDSAKLLTSNQSVLSDITLLKHEILEDNLFGGARGRSNEKLTFGVDFYHQGLSYCRLFSMHGTSTGLSDTSKIDVAEFLKGMVEPPLGDGPESKAAACKDLLERLARRELSEECNKMEDGLGRLDLSSKKEKPSASNDMTD